MKSFVWVAVSTLATVSLAQDFTNLPAYKTAPAVAEAQRKAAAVKAAVELPQPSEAPVAELTVNEFQMKQSDLVGKVVKLTFDQVTSFVQEGSSGYLAKVTFEANNRPNNSGAAPCVEIAVPSEGIKPFKEVYELNGTTRRTTVMVQVLVASKTRALGSRYREDAPEGRKYYW